MCGLRSKAVTSISAESNWVRTSRVSNHRVPNLNPPVVITSISWMFDTRPALCSRSVNTSNTSLTGAATVVATVTVVISVFSLPSIVRVKTGWPQQSPRHGLTIDSLAVVELFETAQSPADGDAPPHTAKNSVVAAPLSVR